MASVSSSFDQVWSIALRRSSSAVCMLYLCPYLLPLSHNWRHFRWVRHMCRYLTLDFLSCCFVPYLGVFGAIMAYFLLPFLSIYMRQVRSISDIDPYHSISCCFVPYLGVFGAVMAYFLLPFFVYIYEAGAVDF